MHPRVSHAVTILGVAAVMLTAGCLLSLMSGRGSAPKAKPAGTATVRAEQGSPRRVADATPPSGEANCTPPAKSLPDVAIEPPPSVDADALRAWARSDPAQATRWLATAPSGPPRDVVLEIVCLEVVSYDPAEALAIADRFGYAGMNLRENLVAQWAERDHGAAKGYAETIPPGPERDRLVGRVAFAWSKEKPAVAAGLVMAEIAPGRTQEDAAIAVIHQWLLRNAADAQRWIESLPDGALRERAAREWEMTAGLVR